MTSRRLAIVVCVIVAVVGMMVRFPGALPGPRVVSAHDHLSVHPLFQEAGAADHGRVQHPHLSDPALQLAALDLRTVTALRAGRAPLWNPDLYGGTPLLADGQSRPLSPITLLRAALPSAPGMAQDLGVAWLFGWCALGFGLWVRRLGLRSAPAIATAAAAALTTPYLSVWLLHPHASTFVWLPWCLLAIETGSATWTALAIAGLWTGGHPGTWVHVGGLVALAWVLRSRRLGPVWGALAGTALAAPLWAPLVEQAGRSTTLQARVGGVLDPSLLLDLVWPGWWGHPATQTWSGPGSWADGQLHPGLAAAVLGVFAGVVAARSNRRWLWLVGVGVFCTGAAIVGLPGPFAHGRLGSVAATVWIPLAALGVSVWARTHPHSAWIAPVLVLATGTRARWNDQHSVPAAQHAAEPAAWVSDVQSAVSDGRILGVDWAAQPNTGALAGLRDLRGYDLPVSVQTHRLMTALSPRPRGPWYPVDTLPAASLLEWWGVRVVLAFPHHAEATAAWAEAADWRPLPLPEGSPLQAWVDPTPGPMAWVAHRSTAQNSLDAGLHALTRRLDRSTVATPREVPALSGSSAITPVTLRRDGGASIELSWPPLHEPGVLVVAEAWAPGWRARLASGTPAVVWPVHGAAMGVQVPPASTGATLYYRPDGWILGQRGFVLGLAMGLVGIFVAARRRRPQPPDEGPCPMPATMPDGGKTRPQNARRPSTKATSAGGHGEGTREDATSTPGSDASRRT